jgi:hypothetical protein
MKRFKLFLTVVLTAFFSTGGMRGQCVGALTVNVTGSSTGGNVTTTITTQPSNQLAAMGGSFTLSVVAMGANLTYQWKKGGVDITPNGTSASYTKTGVTASDAGNYTVVVHGDCGSDVTSTAATITVLSGVSVQIKAFLEGPFKILDGSSMVDGKMSDALTTRTPTFSTLIPMKEPYTDINTLTGGFAHQGGGGGEETTNAVLQVTGNNAIVDWVFIELRSKTAPSTVLFTRSALIQRDGDVVDVDGISVVNFPTAPADDYYIALRHRNHLGFRPLSTVALGALPTALNFTNNSIVFYGVKPALKKITLPTTPTPTDVYVMYAGDANHNGVINSVDKNSFWRVQNGSINYLSADFNLSGSVNAIDKNGVWLSNNSVIQQLD